MKVERYTWSDALIEAQAQGAISNGALLLALKLAKAINWCPKDKRPAGLYWKTEDALKEVGASRTTYFDHRKELMEAGFFTQVKGNLLPTMPDQSVVRTTDDSQESVVRTEDESEESVVRTTESAVRTDQSVVRNPLSVDTLSEDSLSEQEQLQAVVADAPTAVEDEKSSLTTTSPHGASQPQAVFGSEDTRQSVVRTATEADHREAVMDFINGRKRADERYNPEPSVIDAAVALCEDPAFERWEDSTHRRIEAALVKAAVQKMDW